MSFDYDGEFRGMFGDTIGDACDFDGDGHIDETEFWMGMELMCDTPSEINRYDAMDYADSYECDGEDDAYEEYDVAYHDFISSDVPTSYSYGTVATNVYRDNDITVKKSISQKEKIPSAYTEYKRERKKDVKDILLIVTVTVEIFTIAVLCLLELRYIKNDSVLALLIVLGLCVYAGFRFLKSAIVWFVDDIKHLQNIKKKYNIPDRLTKRRNILLAIVCTLLAVFLVVFTSMILEPYSEKYKTQNETKYTKARYSKQTRSSVVSSYSTKKTGKTEIDPYDVDDYLFAEDFYEDHYDDFYDYEDAEDYFYDHD